MRLIDADELIRKTAEAYFEAMEDETLSEYVLDGMNIVRVAVENAVQKAPTINFDINECTERSEHEKENCEILADANNGEMPCMSEITLEEAVEATREMFEEDSKGYQAYLENGGRISAKSEARIQALAMSINALEKCIPRKPKENEHGDELCAVCGGWVHSRDFRGRRKREYCPRCGQRIDWSDEE